MILVIGGAYQGKLDFAREHFALKNSGDEPSVCTCDEKTLEIDGSLPIIDKLHLLIWARQQAGLDPLTYLQQHRELLQGKILICDDVSAGVVPIDTATRLWRESVGRCTVWLAREADQVFRVFCGLATTLKP